MNDKKCATCTFFMDVPHCGYDGLCRWLYAATDAKLMADGVLCLPDWLLGVSFAVNADNGTECNAWEPRS